MAGKHQNSGRPDRPASPDRQITIGERTYTLRFSIMALATLQDHYGLQSIDEVGQRLSDPSRFGVDDMVAVMWAGLKRHHPDLSRDDVLALLDDGGFDALGEITSAFNAAMPEAEPSAEGDPARPR